MQPPSLGPIRQIGYVVGDLDAAIAEWLNIGVGPWYVLHAIVQEAEYRGETCRVTASLALANSGDLQIELIRQTDDTPSIYTEFLAASGPGLHQLAYWASDFDQTLASTQEAGWPIVWRGLEVGGVRYAYLEPTGTPVPVIEVMELNELSEGLGTLVREAASGWDGSNPVRTLQ